MDPKPLWMNMKTCDLDYSSIQYKGHNVHQKQQVPCNMMLYYKRKEKKNTQHCPLDSILFLGRKWDDKKLI